MTVAIPDEHSALIERLRTAEEIVDESNVKADLRPAAFTEVMRRLDGVTNDAAGIHASATRKLTSVVDTGSLAEPLAAVAEAFEVDADVINQLFADDDGGLLLVVPSRRLTKSTRGAMRQIAILVTCARQAGGWDTTWTSAATIRTEVERIGLDSKNLGAVLDALDVCVGQGSGATRQLRAHNESYKAAKAVLVELGLRDSADAA
jgi:hypothetical protein